MNSLDPANDARDDQMMAGVAGTAAGRRTRTMGLPARAAGGPPPPMPDEAAAGEADAEQQRQLLDDAVRPDLAAGVTMAVPAEVRARFEAVHRVPLGGVAVRVVPELDAIGVRGLARGDEILVADERDVEAIEHELGHIVDTALTGAPEANADVGGIDVADDPAREARADAIAAAAREGHSTAGGAPEAPAGVPAASAVALPRLTKRTAINQRASGAFVWTAHKTAATPRTGGGYVAEGLGAVLSTTHKLNTTTTVNHGQTESLDHTIIPAYVDATRAPLPAPPRRFRGIAGAYVVPAPLLGLPTEDNCLYLPAAARTELASLQTQMVDLAQKAPGRVQVDTVFGTDGLANSVVLLYTALDRLTGTPLQTLTWNVMPAADRNQWGTDPVAPAVAGPGTVPASAEWRSHIEWDATTADGDGVHVRASKLGPDHPLGSAPSNATAAGRVTTLQNHAKPLRGAGEAYIAGHLLNDHLGGPGNLAANLAPIPKKANAQMSESIEQPAKRIVNDERGWIRYEVWVTHAHDATSGVDYPAKIRGEIGVLDHAGAEQNVNAAEIDIAAPSAFAAKTAAAPAADRKLDGTAIETSPVMLDEVILSHENDLRPFLRDSTDLYRLIFESELSAEIDDTELTEAWNAILTKRSEYQAAALPTLNTLATLTDAMAQWESDPLARQYLATITVGQLKADLGKLMRDTNKLITDTRPFLQHAAAAVKKELRPTDVLENAQALGLAWQLVREAPEPKTLLDVVRARQTATIPFHAHTLLDARQRGDLVTEQRELTVRDSFRAQPQDPQPTVPMSPVTVFQEYGASTSALDVTARYGVTFTSDRGTRALGVLRTMATDIASAPIVQRLATDVRFTTNKRVMAILTQIKFLQQVSTTALTPPAELLEATAELWHEAIEGLATDDPMVALAFYTELGIT